MTMSIDKIHFMATHARRLRCQRPSSSFFWQRITGSRRVGERATGRPSPPPQSKASRRDQRRQFRPFAIDFHFVSDLRGSPTRLGRRQPASKVQLATGPWRSLEPLLFKLWQTAFEQRFHPNLALGIAPVKVARRCRSLFFVSRLLSAWRRALRRRCASTSRGNALRPLWAVGEQRHLRTRQDRRNGGPRLPLTRGPRRIAL